MAAITVAGVFLLIWVHQFMPSRSAASADLIVDSYQWSVASEPTEQFVFAVLSVCVPVLALLFVHGRPSTHAEVKPGFLGHLLPCLIAALLFLPLVRSDFVGVLLGKFGAPQPHGDAALAASLASSALLAFSFVKLNAPQLWAKMSLLIAWMTFLSVMALQLLSWRLVGIDAVTINPVWGVSADPVFYAISQVTAGLTLLVDLPSQYGLYPELLAPLFRLIGLSVAKVTTVFALMQLGALVALFYVLSRLLRSRLLLAFIGLTLVLLTFETVLYFAGISERYYQYWPIRFFWPALSVLAFHAFASKRTFVRSAMVSLVGGIALVWNLDSGLFVTIAYGAYLAARLTTSSLNRSGMAETHLVGWSRRAYLLALALHALITVVFVSGFLGALVWKAQQPLSLFWLFSYQQIFASIGLMMLPLPREAHPWMSVLGIYLAGLVTSMTAWRLGGANLKADVLFYLSMLGLGLFVYYAGRSHVLNLVTVCWPAALIVAIVVDHLLRATRIKLLDASQLWLAASGIAFLLLASSSLAARLPFLFDSTIDQLANWNTVVDPIVRSELTLIKQRTHGKSDCLILSQRQGIYYAEAGFSSPVKGPGIVETLLKADERQLVGGLQEGSFACVFLGVGPGSEPGFKLDMEKVLANYSVEARNDEGTMLFLKARTAQVGASPKDGGLCCK